MTVAEYLAHLVALADLIEQAEQDPAPALVRAALGTYFAHGDLEAPDVAEATDEQLHALIATHARLRPAVDRLRTIVGTGMAAGDETLIAMVGARAAWGGRPAAGVGRA